MGLRNVVAVLLLVSLASWEIDAYGRMQDPVHRGGAWRKGFKTPINYDDHANNCGGFDVQHKKNNGRCGPCGDNFADARPRKNENTGYYGTGTIVRRYRHYQIVDLDVEITANLQGYFEFSICKLNSTNQIETEDCFQSLEILGVPGSKYQMTQSTKPGHIKLQTWLPFGLFCQRCVLRWHYHAGNNWGICEDGEGRLGCGPQETFRTCSDISIGY